MRIVSLCLLSGALACVPATRPIRPTPPLVPPSGPVGPAVSEKSTVALEIPGVLLAVNGTACVDGRTTVVGVEGAAPLPSYANAATVFLSGFDLRYLESDHHVARLGTNISDIRIEGATLKWHASGFIRDENFDDPYRWCYDFTVIAWNQAQVDARVGQPVYNMDFLFPGFELLASALNLIPGYTQDPAFVGKKGMALLPDGFDFGWEEGFSETDHHLLQLAYRLNPGERYVEGRKDYHYLPQPPLAPANSLVDSGYVSWELHGIYKDNDTVRDYRFGAQIQPLVGNDVALISPPFTILPQDNIGFFGRRGCIEPPGGARTDEFTVENIPFEAAVPVLTGWSIGYPCTDEHVKEIGIRLVGFTYERPPGATAGRLRYQLNTILCDDDCRPGHIVTHEISILGFRPLPPHPPPQPPPIE